MDHVVVLKLRTGQTVICTLAGPETDHFQVRNPFVLMGMPTGELLMVPWIEGLRKNVKVEIPRSFVVTWVDGEDMDPNLVNSYVSKTSNIVVPERPNIVR